MKLHKDVTHKKSIKAFGTLENKFIKIHGNKYNYDHAIYKGAKSKISIYCNMHKEYYMQEPAEHLRGRGCPRCGIEKRLDTIETFIDKAKIVHGDLYSYENSIYVNTATKISIYCKYHNEIFEQTPFNHLNGKGCLKCGQIASKKSKLLTTKTFIDLAIEQHGDKFMYDKVEYKSAKIKVEIYCKNHKGYFWQTPTGHLSGKGCRKCADVANRGTTETFVEKAICVHGNAYDYTDTVYTSNKAKINILCIKCNNSFTQTASAHLQGKGCPYCGSGGFNIGLPGMLYYFKVSDGVNTAWKIGITNNTVQTRYSKKELKYITDIIYTHFKSGKDAYDREQEILKEYKQYKYEGENLLISGNTELFNIDIFNLKDPLWT